MAVGEVSPNPYVGAVIVKDGKIIATGYHKGSGHAHAELDAINNAKESLVGSTIYSNLEPCCHTNKKTPPCAQRLILERFSKVVISNLDPNPLVAGQGVKILREAGIEVITDILKDEGEILNEVFFTHITKNRPFIHLKYAQTIDGKIATISGDSKWITSEKSREFVHTQRNQYDAIMIGAKTALADNPKLTVRKDDKVKPIKRVILTNKILKDEKINLLTDEYKDYTIQSLLKSNLDLSSILSNLYMEHGIKSIYVEGGAKTLDLFINEKLYDKVSIFIAPKIIGKGRSPHNELQLNFIKDAIEFKNVSWKIIDDNAVMTAYRKN